MRLFIILFFIFVFALPAHAQNAVLSIPAEEVEDTPVKDALIVEANLVQIVLNDEHRQGVDWEAIVSDFHTLQLKKEDNPVWKDKKYRITVGSVSNEDYAVLLDALDTVGRMTQTTQAAMALQRDQKQALNIVLPDNKASNNLRVDLVVMDTKDGPKLRVEPYIGALIKDNAKPVAVTLKTQTDMALKENTTIVIGSIISEQEITKTHKFPLLGSLPIVGLVFRSHGRLMQKTETVVFLTPRIKAVPDGEE